MEPICEHKVDHRYCTQCHPPTPMGTCGSCGLSNCDGSGICLDCRDGICHTAPPTEPLIPMDVIARIGTIDDTPTPNTGTEEWEERFIKTFKGDVYPVIKFIRNLLATQKSQLIAEVEKLRKDVRVPSKLVELWTQKDHAKYNSDYGWNGALNVVITKLNGL